jgi:hypothetical protein
MPPKRPQAHLDSIPPPPSGSHASLSHQASIPQVPVPPHRMMVQQQQQRVVTQVHPSIQQLQHYHVQQMNAAAVAQGQLIQPPKPAVQSPQQGQGQGQGQAASSSHGGHGPRSRSQRQQHAAHVQLVQQQQQLQHSQQQQRQQLQLQQQQQQQHQQHEHEQRQVRSDSRPGQTDGEAVQAAPPVPRLAVSPVQDPKQSLALKTSSRGRGRPKKDKSLDHHKEENRRRQRLYRERAKNNKLRFARRVKILEAENREMRKRLGIAPEVPMTIPGFEYPPEIPVDGESDSDLEPSPSAARGLSPDTAPFPQIQAADSGAAVGSQQIASGVYAGSPAMLGNDSSVPYGPTLHNVPPPVPHSNGPSLGRRAEATVLARSPPLAPTVRTSRNAVHVPVPAHVAPPALAQPIAPPAVPVQPPIGTSMLRNRGSQLVARLRSDPVPPPPPGNPGAPQPASAGTKRVARDGLEHDAKRLRQG